MSRRRRKVQRQPIAQINIITSVLGAISLVVFATVISAASETGGQLPKPVSGLGLLCCFISVYSGVLGSRTLGDVEHSTLFRIIGFALPALAGLLWVLVYIYGIFVF